MVTGKSLSNTGHPYISSTLECLEFSLQFFYPHESLQSSSQAMKNWPVVFQNQNLVKKGMQDADDKGCRKNTN